jgi:hypothetical protein
LGMRSFSSTCTIIFQRNSSTNANSSFAACSQEQPGRLASAIWTFPDHFALIYAPKVAGLSPGFQPWDTQNKRVGLKGREDEEINLAPIAERKLMRNRGLFQLDSAFTLLVRCVCRPFRAHLGGGSQG